MIDDDNCKICVSNGHSLSTHPMQFMPPWKMVFKHKTTINIHCSHTKQRNSQNGATQKNNQ